MEKVKKYAINEIFYSLQGEGYWTGHPAIFIRFAGCNLRCPFCDTNHEISKKYTLTELLGELMAYKCKFIVLTGGEPTLQVDEVLLNYLKSQDYMIAMETNGTRPIPRGVDWITVSPKDIFVDNAEVVVQHADELKVVFDGVHLLAPPITYAVYKYIQPCDTGDKERNEEIIKQCVQFVKDNPTWSLSLQTQKILNIR